MRAAAGPARYTGRSEEPLEVSTQIFKWAASSNPFSYVGVHWTDLFGYYLGVRPLSLHAVGQKMLLTRWRDDAHPHGIERSTPCRWQSSTTTA
jgi:hypothetical protein